MVKPIEANRIKEDCTMRKFALVLLVGLVATLAVPSVPSVKATGCSPPGYQIPFTEYYWIANGAPADSSCWSHDPARAAVVSTTTCGWTSNAWQFYYGGTISQSFTIPTTMTGQNFSMSYLVDFDDPNNNGAWNKFSMYVQDTTTGAILASDYFDGSMGDLTCAYRSKFWNANLAGHTIQVIFSGTRGFSNTNIRVRQIGLWQY
jgi:hypothetical protein